MIRPTLRASATALLLVVAIAVSGCTKPTAESFKATDVTGAPFGREFALTDHTGKPRTLTDFKGKVVVVFFGYTFCPDVCPTTMAALREVKEKLGADAGKLQVLFITVDPERDTPQVLSVYVPAFDPDFLGLYGDAEATQKVAREFKVLYQKSAGTTPTSYTVDHSAKVFIYDTQGRLRLLAAPDFSVDSYLHDVRMLLAGR
ncbi:MAG: SCO family protein [Casimicrobiaceae bacterium]